MKTAPRFLVSAKTADGEPITGYFCYKIISRNGRSQVCPVIQVVLSDCEIVTHEVDESTVEHTSVKVIKNKPFAECPNCGECLEVWENTEEPHHSQMGYCPECGQRLDWED